MQKRVVYKFGGSCLASDQDYTTAARFLIRDAENSATPIFVVVGARKGETDLLLKDADGRFGDPWERIDYVAKAGEFVSANTMSAKLNEESIFPIARVVSPWDLKILVDGDDPFNGNLVEIDHDCDTSFADLNDPIKHLPVKFLVVPGYVGVHKTKKLGGIRALIALGRGASDLIAVEVARATRSKLKLVKSAQSIYSVSPDFVDNPKPITHMTPDQALRVLEYIRSDEQFIMANAVKHAQKRNVALEFCSMENPEQSSRIDPAFGANEPIEFRALPVKERVVRVSGTISADTDSVWHLYAWLRREKIPFNDGGTETLNGESKVYIFAEINVADKIATMMAYSGRRVSKIDKQVGSLITLIDTSLDPEGNHFMRTHKALRGISVLHSMSSGIIMHIFVKSMDTP